MRKTMIYPKIENEIFTNIVHTIVRVVCFGLKFSTLLKLEILSFRRVEISRFRRVEISKQTNAKADDSNYTRQN